MTSSLEPSLAKLNMARRGEEARAFLSEDFEVSWDPTPFRACRSRLFPTGVARCLAGINVVWIYSR
jgi:hypothetical protein